MKRIMTTVLTFLAGSLPAQLAVMVTLRVLEEIVEDRFLDGRELNEETLVQLVREWWARRHPEQEHVVSTSTGNADDD